MLATILLLKPLRLIITLLPCIPCSTAFSVLNIISFCGVGLVSVLSTQNSQILRLRLETLKKGTFHRTRGTTSGFIPYIIDMLLFFPIILSFGPNVLECTGWIMGTSTPLSSNALWKLDRSSLKFNRFEIILVTFLLLVGNWKQFSRFLSKLVGFFFVSFSRPNVLYSA